MGCCGQNPIGSGAEAVDTCKRVNYTLGMLLGVDDFVQESTYHTARRQALTRELLGYGTVRGLDVAVEADGDKGPRLRVTPGVASLPSGRMVCVDAEQCCNLNDWLDARKALVQQALVSDSPPAHIVLHAVLSYAECLTDNVPIPGEPCRSEDELLQPSRVADGFRLELRLQAPAQREEDALRDFVDWLAGTPVVSGSPPLDEAGFIEQLRDAAHAWLVPGSPPATPDDFMLGSPSGALRANEGLLRAALRLWSTELRPLWMARADCGCGAAKQTDADDAVLLATLTVALEPTGASSGWRVSDDTDKPVLVDESRRPLLLSLRMVQELITQNPTPEAGDSVQSATAFGLIANAGNAGAYSRADHNHGTPTLPNLGGDLSGSMVSATVARLLGRSLSPKVPVTGDALLFDGASWKPGSVSVAIPPLPNLGGDLSGAIGSATVARLLGRSLSPLAPNTGDALLFDGAAWKPGPVSVTIPPLPNLGGDLSGAIGSATLDRLQGQPVKAPAPNENDVLRFVGGLWVAAPAPASTASGNFVGRASAPYEIVAAGEIEVDLSSGASVPVTLSSYGGLKAGKVSPGDSIERSIIQIGADVTDGALFKSYVVKLTPIWLSGAKLEYRLYLLDAIKAGNKRIEFQVLLAADSQIVDGNFRFRFQVEVSRFGAQ